MDNNIQISDWSTFMQAGPPSPLPLIDSTRGQGTFPTHPWLNCADARVVGVHVPPSHQPGPLPDY